MEQEVENMETAQLIEGNHWGDTYWGVCYGQGLNHLGKTLARVRAELPYIANHDYFGTVRQNVYNDEIVDYAALDAAMTHAIYKKLQHDMAIADDKFKDVVDAATLATITTFKVRGDK